MKKMKDEKWQVVNVYAEVDHWNATIHREGYDPDDDMDIVGLVAVETQKDVQELADRIVLEHNTFGDLLETLKESWAQMDTSYLIDSTIQKIKAAIAKAEDKN